MTVPEIAKIFLMSILLKRGSHCRLGDRPARFAVRKRAELIAYDKRHWFVHRVYRSDMALSCRDRGSFIYKVKNCGLMHPRGPQAIRGPSREYNEEP